MFAVTTHGNVAETLRRGEGTGLLGAFAVTTQGNVAESLRRGEEDYGWSRRVGGDGGAGETWETVE